MSRVPTFTRSASRLAGLALAGLVLASCASTSAVVHPLVVGTPSASIAVPLGTVACTPGATCVAVGASSLGVGASSTGEYRRPDGLWVALPVPGLVGAAITTGGCWAGGCLLAGRQVRGDLVWRFHVAAHAVTLAAAPTGGAGIAAIDCVSGGVCLALDTTTDGVTRLVTSPDGATSWGAPSELAWADGLTPTALSCVDATTCVVAATRTASATSSSVLIESTRDGGATWSAGSAPTTWRRVTSLSCRPHDCLAIATTATGTRVARSADRGAHWRVRDPHALARAAACTTAGHCVLVGTTTTGQPWLATLRADQLVAATLRYVPSSPVAVACGTRTCAAVGVATVMAVAP